MNDSSSSGALHPRALNPSTFADAPPQERATLAVVAITIEAERERLRPGFGKGNYGARGFAPHPPDTVDTMGWDDLLQLPEVMTCCEAVTEAKASKIVQMVRDHCGPTNSDAFRWMQSYYALAEAAPEIAKSVAIEAVRAHKKHLDQQAAIQRSSQTAKAGRSRKRVAEVAESSQKLREIWVSGKYDSKAKCIDEEAAALNLSISSAQKALRNVEKRSPN